MGHRWLTWIASFALATGLLSGAHARAAAAGGPDAGILEQLAVPVVPAQAALPGQDHGDGYTAGPPLSADAIAVPTPTAAGSGLVVLAALITWRTARKVLGRV